MVPRNDPIYVPRSALDPDEIVFTGIEADADNTPDAQQARVGMQREALERFIGSTPCLRRQRGRIMERNSCREPWAHTTSASLRQMIPIGSQTLEAQLDVFNLLNLLNREWGLRRLANSVLLEHVGQGSEERDSRSRSSASSNRTQRGSPTGRNRRFSSSSACATASEA